jgi:GPH family glycoside/pentoside/hexuronide:cation symporter
MKPAEPSAPNAERVPLAAVLAYGAPIFALSGFLFFVQFFFLKFATDVLLLSPVLVGLIFALGRAWDAVSDPMAGAWSDRTRTRLGRRRPWMLAALPGLAVFFAMTWIPPEGLGATALLAWVTVALFGFYTAFTAYGIPHSSLGAELSRDYHDRNRIFGVRHASFILGLMLSFGGMQVVTNAEDPRAAVSELVAFGLPLGIAVLLLPPLLIRERAEYQGRGADSSFRALADVLRNPHARLLLAVNFIEMMAAGVLGVLSPYLVEYVLKRPDLIGPLPAVFVVCSVGSIPLWVRLSRRFGKRDTWIAAMIGTALSFGGMFFVGPNDVGPMLALIACAGISQGCGGTVGHSILADVIDYDEYRTHERKEGAYTAAWGFTLKAGQALVIVLTGWVLHVSGFQPNVEQTPVANLALRGLFAGLPFTAFLIGAWMFSRFRLDQREHERIRRELERRAEQSAATHRRVA